ncbi:MAG TPA: hypothetical protein VFK07_00430 [Candidatus Paceibacterota bacterium]|nr:hypothetical protein [Candidatus Paceibacterota bacterium]
MIKKLFIPLFALLFVASLAYAADTSSVQFPIASLGNCSSKQDCKTYCDQLSNMKACLDFASEHGLMSKSDIARARDFQALAAAGKTPGDCDSKDACKAYCSDPDHASDCLQFAKNNGLISKTDADRAESVLKDGGPGGCATKDACVQYCNDQTHAQECLEFAQDHGLIKSGKADEIAKDIDRLRSGPGDNDQLGQCLHDTLGANGLDRVQSGKFVPGTSALSKVRSCFDQFGKQVGPDQGSNGKGEKAHPALPSPAMSHEASESEHEIHPTPAVRLPVNLFPTNEPERPNHRSERSGPESFLGPQGLVGAIVHFFSN